MGDRDIAAISSYEHAEQAPDPNESGPGHPYRCVSCHWAGRGETALRHYRETGHAIRGRDWPKGWPNCEFSVDPPLISTCGWCDGAKERTAELQARGFNVTTGICDKCMAKWKRS